MPQAFCSAISIILTAIQSLDLCGALWVHGLLEVDAQFLPERCQLLDVLLVLAGVLDLGLDALEYPHGGGEVVDAAGGAEGSGDDRWGWDQIVGESVVEVALQLEDVLDRVEFLLVSVLFTCQWLDAT